MEKVAELTESGSNTIVNLDTEGNQSDNDSCNNDCNNDCNKRDNNNRMIWIFPCCERPVLRSDDSGIYKQAVYFFQSTYDFMSAPQCQQHSIILLNVLLPLLISMFFLDLVTSGVICHDFSNICNDVYILSWWSGLYHPYFLEGQNYFTLFTYTLHHLSLAHISLNILLLSYPLYYLERKYGTLRLLVLTILTAVGGGIFGYWLYDDLIVVGFSGVIYGYLATNIADVTLNWETVRAKIWSGILFLSIIISIILEYYYFSNYAVWAHIGGSISGLAFGLLILPNFHIKKWEWILPIFAIITICLQFIVLPCFLFIH